MLKKINPLIIQAVLFVLTIFTTTLVGAEWVGIRLPNDSEWDFFSRGFAYSIPFLGILTIHEMGHYLVARYYKVAVTLPYYIPIFIPGLMPQIGTMGAVIKMNSRSASKKEIFDIGVAGPLAGFFAAIIILFYGFTNLPEREHIFKVHSDYKKVEKNYNIPYESIVYSYKYAREVDSIQHINLLNYYKEHKNDNLIKLMTFLGLAPKTLFTPQEKYEELALGKNLIILFFENYVVQDKSLIPNKYEMAHYPFIFAGFLALFFTALNLFPIGQLDGGHVVYGLFGYEKHKKIATVVFVLFIFIAGLGIFKDNILNINFFTANAFDMFYFAAFYLGFLYFVFQKTFVTPKTTLMVAVIVFSLQFIIEYTFPTFEGVSYGLVFGLLIGRFLGTDHPPAVIEEELDLKRKLIGWFALLVFILCLTPKVFEIVEFK